MTLLPNDPRTVAVPSGDARRRSRQSSYKIRRGFAGERTSRPPGSFEMRSLKSAPPRRPGDCETREACAPVPLGVEFVPPHWLRNPHLQSILGSSGLRRWMLGPHARELEQRSREEILELDGGVRLQGFYTPQRTSPMRRGLVMLLHGWEGHAKSNYVVATAASLLSAGYDVYRLNFRDHGDSHGLNLEPFHSCRLAEVLSAVARVFARPGAGVRAIAGFSLGGNFALRVASAAPARGIPIDYALAVCPVIDPAAGLHQLEHAPIYHAYFMRKWRLSLRRKQSLFPAHDLISREALRLNMRELTRALVMRYTEFDSLEAYLDGYSVAGDRLAGLRIPTTILAATDDPVIPLANFRALRLPACVELDIARYGGHCAFLGGANLRSFVEEYLLARLQVRARAEDSRDRGDADARPRVASGTGAP